MQKFYKVSVFKLKKNVSDFKKKILQRVRFWNENFTKCQFLNWKKYNASDFEVKNFTTCQILY